MRAVCPACGADVLTAGPILLDPERTTTGPLNLSGHSRHPQQIADSIRRDRAEGYRRHYCENTGTLL